MSYYYDSPREKLAFVVFLLGIVFCIALGAYWMFRLAAEVCAEFC